MYNDRLIVRAYLDYTSTALSTKLSVQLLIAAQYTTAKSVPHLGKTRRQNFALISLL
jgi:hypothetical protein